MNTDIRVWLIADRRIKEARTLNELEHSIAHLMPEIRKQRRDGYWRDFLDLYQKRVNEFEKRRPPKPHDDRKWK